MKRQQKAALPTKNGPENQKNKHASHFWTVLGVLHGCFWRLSWWQQQLLPSSRGGNATRDTSLNTRARGWILGGITWVLLTTVMVTATNFAFISGWWWCHVMWHLSQQKCKGVDIGGHYTGALDECHGDSNNFCLHLGVVVAPPHVTPLSTLEVQNGCQWCPKLLLPHQCDSNVLQNAVKKIL